MNAVPRQGYFLGGIGDAIKDTVKGVAKGISGILKSDIGKAALIGGGLFGIPGTQFGGLLGKGSLANIIGQKAMTQAPFAKGTGLKGFFQNILGGEKTLGTTAKVFAGGSALGAVLEASGLGADEKRELVASRNIDALKGYLRKGYRNLNPEAKDEEVETFVEENTREYAATGGRIGFNKGLGIIVEDGLARPDLSNISDKEIAAKIKQHQMQQESVKKFLEKIKESQPENEKGLKPVPMPSGDRLKEMLDKFKVKKAYGGRIGYAKGTDEIVDQASGIMGLPQRTNQAGVKELDLRETGGFIPPVGVKEKADDIPAMLSNNEFVFTADAVRGMGNGDVNKGAQRLYDQMKMLEKGGIV